MDTDAQVLQSVLAALSDGTAEHFSRLEVAVFQGEVRITGRVNSYAERKSIERSVRAIDGVVTVSLAIGVAAVSV